MKIHDFTKPEFYKPDETRYDAMSYRRCGKSGILLPELSLGLWHNFGYADNILESRAVLRKAFDAGITHFDLANNYGPPFGAAEETFGMLFRKDFAPFRDELIISTKAGYDMWNGPYGNLGSRKYLIASIDQSLARMGLGYVDIFYHHRPDPDTPLEETMGALDQIVRSGKALYAGISNYPPELTARAVSILREMRTPFIIHQARYSMLDRWVEDGLLQLLEREGIGMIAFSPLEQGLLTDRYIDGIPDDSRAARKFTYLNRRDVEKTVQMARRLNSVAADRGQSLSQMAISWLLKDRRVTSVLVGVSNVSQLENNLAAIGKCSFSESEIGLIERIISENESL